MANLRSIVEKTLRKAGKDQGESAEAFAQRVDSLTASLEKEIGRAKIGALNEQQMEQLGPLVDADPERARQFVDKSLGWWRRLQIETAVIQGFQEEYSR